MRALLVEDDAAIVTVARAGLEEEGFTVVATDSVRGRDAALAEDSFDVMLTDIVLKDGDGIASLESVRSGYPDLPIIVISAQNTLDTAVRATETGAFEYFPKPFDLDELVEAARRAAQSGNAAAPADDAPGEGLPLVGRSQAMQGVFRLITRVLGNDLSVLITGESGTGKELVAEAIHTLGHRKTGPFVAVNTAAIPAELIESELFGHEKGAFTGAVARQIGKFEAANGGTLFLDEIGDMPMEAQTRLLRALQSGRIRRVGGREEIRVDVRILAATNRQLEPLIEQGKFREDLFYRLNVLPIHLPPLRERADDIPDLARHFLRQAAAEGLPARTLTTEAAERLKAHRWRGNVRELRNVTLRAAVLARETEVEARDLDELLDTSDPGRANGPVTFEAALVAWLDANPATSGTLYHAASAAFERPLFTYALQATGGNQLRAAKLLGINRNTLRARLTDLAIEPERFSRSA